MKVVGSWTLFLVAFKLLLHRQVCVRLSLIQTEPLNPLNPFCALSPSPLRCFTDEVLHSHLPQRDSELGLHFSSAHTEQHNAAAGATRASYMIHCFFPPPPLLFLLAGYVVRTQGDSDPTCNRVGSNVPFFKVSFLGCLHWAGWL